MDVLLETFFSFSYPFNVAQNSHTSILEPMIAVVLKHTEKFLLTTLDWQPMGLNQENVQVNLRLLIDELVRVVLEEQLVAKKDKTEYYN